jgi:SAM-dependent methyltransferase
MKILKSVLAKYKTIKMLQRMFEPLFELSSDEKIENILKEFDARIMGLRDSSSLDIGCGSVPKNPFHADRINGIDIRENFAKGIKYADLTLEAIPHENNTFDFITAFDFIEHIPRVVYLPERRFPFIELMNEVWRTLKPNGIFLSYTPVFPFPSVFQDPTHVNILTHDTFTNYFDDTILWGRMYGFKGSFHIKRQVLVGDHLLSILQKI